MSLDHYVPQVHLRNFYSPQLGTKLMYAVSKTTGKEFTPNSESICRIDEGNTNSYLIEDRLIEEFLKTVEPKYNAVVKKVIDGQIDQECVHVIAGLTAYLVTCSPAAMRIQSAPLKSVLESTARGLDAAGALPKSPASLGAASLTELLESGKVKLTVDPKYPQAIGIAQILQSTAIFGNSKWEILRAPADAWFFTSDYPVAIEDSDDPRVLNRIVPLTPTLAVRIKPDVSLSRAKLSLTFERFGYRTQAITRREVRALNQLLVRCAEDLVLYRDDEPWVKPFIKKNSAFRIETGTQELRTPGSTLLISNQRIVPVRLHPGRDPVKRS